ncbi:MAG: adenine phosphoribosyltransferase [Succinivibrionaceae bacterium]
MNQIEFLKSCVKSIPDFPKPGILFRDITSLCEHPKAFPLMIDVLAREFLDAGITKVAATEARGFVFGAAVASKLNCGFVLVRKKGKLPREVYSESYTLEYGENVLEIHKDAISSNDRVLIVDDLIATGGTIDATIKLVKKCGGSIEGCAFAISLPDLGGESRIEKEYKLKCVSVLDFPGH